MSATVADRARDLIVGVLGAEPLVPIRFWDGSSLGDERSSPAIVVKHPRALRRLLYAPNELGLGRAYVAGDLDIEGDVFTVFGLRDMLGDRRDHVAFELGIGHKLRLARLIASVGTLGLPPEPPPEEARLRGLLHSRGRDAQAIAHHYDVSNDFYRLILGETMTYSCAYFPSERAGLDEAQRAKHDLVCRKLGLTDASHLLDVGCGWGEMAIHAAARYGARVVGITLSKRQADLAAKRVAEAGVGDRITIRIQDYRDVRDGPFDAISSIGMFEHVGGSRTQEYFETLFGLLKPGGRLLNHAISKPSGRPGFDRRSFISRYVFPDGELQEVGSVVSAMQTVGFEARDVESLREHYARTLRHWVANLETAWDAATELAGHARARIWRLYMAGSALSFDSGRINVHQVLGIKPAPDGASGMPPTRRGFIPV